MPPTKEKNHDFQDKLNDVTVTNNCRRTKCYKIQSKDNTCNTSKGTTRTIKNKTQVLNTYRNNRFH